MAPYARAAAPYVVLRVQGPDAAEFLHRLCTQDVLGLAEGAGRPAAFLDAKGKVLATCGIYRCDDAYWLETQAAQSERLAALLERYHFTEKLTIERPDLGPCQEIVQWASNVPAQDWKASRNGVLMLSSARRLVLFQRVYGGAVSYAQLHDDHRETPVVMQPLDAARAECVRMLVGFLRVGVETEPTTLALEADLDDHISTTKGCYTGQEIVARIHTYGHVNRKACLLLLPAGAAITAAQPLHDEDGIAVGRVLHALPIPDHDARLGVGYLPKDFQAIGSKLALADGGAVEVIGYEVPPSAAPPA